MSYEHLPQALTHLEHNDHENTGLIISIDNIFLEQLTNFETKNFFLMGNEIGRFCNLTKPGGNSFSYGRV